MSAPMMAWHGLMIYLAANGLELAGFATTAVGIWLTARRSMWCWPIVLAADIFYILVFREAMLLSDALLQVFYLAFTLYGWWHWWRGVRKEGEVKVVPLGRRTLCATLAAGTAGSIALGIAMIHLHAALPFVDATLASFSLVASWWGARKHIANWWLWIVIDVLYIPEYLYKGLRLTAILYGLLVALAVIGLRAWSRAAQTDHNAAQMAS